MEYADFDISSLSDFENEVFKKIEEDTPERIIEFLTDIANEAIDDLESKTPLSDKKKPKNKHMKNKWKVKKVERIGNLYSVEIRNTAPHAHLYEDGHIAENGTLVAGSHILELKIDELEIEFPNRIKAMVSQELGKL